MKNKEDLKSRRYGKTHHQIGILAKYLNEDKSVFIAGMINPKDYIERLSRDFGITVIAEPKYVTKNTEIILEDVPPYRGWKKEHEPLLTGYEFRKYTI